jgi:predicted transposase YbfD/YdcC
MMAIEGAVVTIDAMGCRRAIAKKIGDKKADYIIALKDNRGTLHEDVKLSSPSRKPENSRIRSSPAARRWTAIMVASKPANIR